MDIINEYLNRTRHVRTLSDGSVYDEIRPHIKCSDGFTVSVQASATHYCFPQENGLEEYKKVELGFPSAEDPLIMEYAESPETPTATVYGCVPVKVVCELIEKHGGIVN